MFKCPASACQPEAHHASSVAVVTLGHLGARLAALPITPRAVVIYIHTQLLTCALRCLRKRKLHHKLWENRYVTQTSMTHSVHVCLANSNENVDATATGVLTSGLCSNMLWMFPKCIPPVNSPKIFLKSSSGSILVPPAL